MTTEKLTVTSLEVRDVLGANQFSMEAGAVTVISGRNGSGKTSALAALQSAIGGGNLAKISRVGDDDEEINPEVVLLIDGDEGSHYRVEKTGKGTTVRKQVGETAGFEVVPSPQRFLGGLFDNRLSNPIEFLNAADKDRVLMLLGALPIELDHAALWDSLGIEPDELSAVPAGLHPLQELAFIRDLIFRERTGVNRDAKQKSASAEQTRRAAPAVLPPGHEQDILVLEEKANTADERITKGIAEAKGSCKQACDKMEVAAQTDTEKQRQGVLTETERRRSAFDTEVAEWKAELEERIAHEAAEMMADIAEEEKLTERTIGGKMEIVRQEVAKLQETRDTDVGEFYSQQREVEGIRVRVAELREQAKAAVKAKTLHDQAELFDEEAEELRTTSEALTAAIEALDRYRQKLASDLPIPGLEVDGRNITVDGVPFSQLNTARRIEIAVKISCLRAQDHPLKVVFVDGAECLDEENFAALKAALLAEGCQAFVGKVQNSDLTVETE